MAKKPLTALLMHPVVQEEFFRAEHMQKLDEVCTLIAPQPFANIESLARHLGQIEVLITSWGCPRIDETTLDMLPRLQLIAHLAGSVKGFIDEAAWRRGIKVINAVAANAVPVAEYTLGAILFANKKLFQFHRLYTEHQDHQVPWDLDTDSIGNYGKTIGIIGASHVGRLVIEYLQPFDLRVLLYDPYATPLEARQWGTTKVGLTELLSQADVVSVHAPLLPDTRGMLGVRELALLRDGAVIINTARGAIIDPAALHTELVRGRLSAVLDTTEPEVLPADHPFYRLPNVYLTPHIAGSMGNETQRLTDYIVAELDRFHRGMRLHHQVKREHLARLA